MVVQEGLRVIDGKFFFTEVPPIGIVLGLRLTQAGDILVTITKSDGMASLATAVNANATVNRIVDMQVIGTIGTETDFSSSITDYCKFSGGS